MFLNCGEFEDVIMDSVSEEAYNNFIEVSNEADDYEDFEELGDIDSEKENSKKAKSEPTKLAQIDKIIAFVKGKQSKQMLKYYLCHRLTFVEYNDQPIEKSVYDSLWTSLVDDLNSLGPPIYTIDKWKRVWSQYKYRNKKRFLTREGKLVSMIIV